MSPSTAVPNPSLEEDPLALAEERAALEELARERPIVAERGVAGEEEDEDEDEDEEDEDDEDDDEDVEEDDDADTDEEGYERTPMRDPVAPGPLDTSNRVAETDSATHAAPDVGSDRIVPSTDAEPEGSLDRVKSAALGIQQIEDLEDDAKGG
jgi:hypothetical protein